MVKQISLDAWQIKHLTELLTKGSEIVAKTDKPIVLYRQILEEEDSSYEEIVCILTHKYVTEQRISSGGLLPPTFHQQIVYSIASYSPILLRKSRDRVLKMIDFLEEQLDTESE